MRRQRRHQRGVAVITALLLTALAVTIVASLFWSQQVQIRLMENQRVQSQSEWVLRGMLDWARRVLREDARVSALDYADEAWAVPMASTELEAYVDHDAQANVDGDSAGPGMSASLVDAQSRFNLSNLAQGKIVDLQQLAVFKRLLAALQLDPALANAAMMEVLAAQGWQAGEPLPGIKAPASSPAWKSVLHAPLKQLDDLLAAPGFTHVILEKLKPHVVILPVPTPVNVNTAGAQVLAALMNQPVAVATSLIASRKSAYFRDAADFLNRADVPADAKFYAFKSDFFLLDAEVKFERGRRAMQALIYRKSTGNTTVKWLRQF